MKFPFGTKEETDIHLKVVADPTVDETKWLPAMEVLAGKQIVPPEAVVDPLKKPHPLKPLLTFFGGFFTFVILVAGQVYMVTAAAVGSGEMASSLFKVSFERSMFHCGPQDSYMGVFILAAIPIFWCAWYLRERRFLRYSALCILGTGVSLLFAAGVSISAALQIGLAALTLALLGLFHLSGSYLSSFRQYWPRSFSVTKWLLISYIPAMVALSWEFKDLDLGVSSLPPQVNPSAMVETVFLIAVFCWLPALLTGLNAKTQQFRSALGLALIGQFPVLLALSIYCIANLLMLAAVNLWGGPVVADFFLKLANGAMSPDFDWVKSSNAELIGKFISSVVVFASLIGGIFGGSFLATIWNMRRNKKRLQSSS